MLLMYLITACLYVVIVGLDITIFFLAVRIVNSRWPWRWVVSFDSVGRPIVDGIVEVLDHKSVLSKTGQMASTTKLAICLISLCVVRLILQGALVP